MFLLAVFSRQLYCRGHSQLLPEQVFYISKPRLILEAGWKVYYYGLRLLFIGLWCCETFDTAFSGRLCSSDSGECSYAGWHVLVYRIKLFWPEIFRIQRLTSDGWHLLQWCVASLRVLALNSRPVSFRPCLKNKSCTIKQVMRS